MDSDGPRGHSGEDAEEDGEDEEEDSWGLGDEEEFDGPGSFESFSSTEDSEDEKCANEKIKKSAGPRQSQEEQQQQQQNKSVIPSGPKTTALSRALTTSWNALPSFSMDSNPSSSSSITNGSSSLNLRRDNNNASGNGGGEKRLSRLFSLRKNSSSLLGGSLASTNSSSSSTIHSCSALNNNEEPNPKSFPVILGPPPPGPHGCPGSQEALKRRHIVQTLVSSENNYVAALERLLNDYKKPLEDSSPPILSPSKISTLFHRIPDILQVHLLFRIALRGVIASWDTAEKIGDVFVASFSKASVLETYSDFINNFSEASSLLSKAKARGSSAFGDFLSLRQIGSPDRLSLFGLLVKPVQRFPQFILLLQDLLRETPPGHGDRMALQLALTTLESLAEMLNERKREAEQIVAFREKIKSLGGGGRTRSSRGLLDPRESRYLLKEEDVTQLDFGPHGTRSKARRLLLVNDALLCVSVSGRFSEVDIGTGGGGGGGGGTGGSRRRLSLKWAVPIRDVEVVLDGSSVLGRVLKGGPTSSHSSGQNSVDRLAGDMRDLMSDFETLSRVKSLLGSLKGNYEGLAVINESLATVQGRIHDKDEEMRNREASLLTLSFRSSASSSSSSSKGLGGGDSVSFQTADPNSRKDWVSEIRLAQLALDPENSPAWDVLEDERNNACHKLPLYVKALPVLSEEKSLTELTVGVSYTIPGARGPRYPSTYVWVSAFNGSSSLLKVFSHPAYKELSSLRHNSYIKHIEFVPGTSSDASDESPSLRSSLVWISTKRMIIIYSAADPERFTEITRFSVPSDISSLLYSFDSVWIGLSNGILASLKRSSHSTTWDLSHPLLLKLSHSGGPLNCLLPVLGGLYVAWGTSVGLLELSSLEITKSFSVKPSEHEPQAIIEFMSSSGVGLWIALKGSPVICLYHTETFRHLQDINIASNVTRVLSARDVRSPPGRAIHVSALLAVRGLLWVGTNVGIALTVPLPRLEGVPIISGRANISYHAHFGPVSFFLNVITARSPTSGRVMPCGVIPEEDEQQQQAPLRKMNSEGVIVPAPIRGKAKALRLSSSPILLKRISDRRRSTSSSSALKPTSTATGEVDVHSLYGELLNVPPPLESSSSSKSAPIRKSDPDLSSCSNNSSFHRRRLSRPKSLDLSSWSMESRLTCSSSSEVGVSSSSSNSSSSTNTPGVSRNASFASHNSAHSMGEQTQHQQPQHHHHSKRSCSKEPRTLVVLMGGRGIINWRLRTPGEPSSRPVNNSDATLVVWEVKV